MGDGSTVGASSGESVVVGGTAGCCDTEIGVGVAGADGRAIGGVVEGDGVVADGCGEVIGATDDGPFAGAVVCGMGAAAGCGVVPAGAVVVGADIGSVVVGVSETGC